MGGRVKVASGRGGGNGVNVTSSGIGVMLGGKVCGSVAGGVPRFTQAKMIKTENSKAQTRTILFFVYIFPPKG
jgi:hypothetical protein